MTFVRHEDGLIIVDVHSYRGGTYSDGHVELKPSDPLFGKTAGDILDGVYTDDGAFFSALGDFKPMPALEY